ncbi:unnamed protein product [Closterium sp. NIES-54]
MRQTKTTVATRLSSGIPHETLRLTAIQAIHPLWITHCWRWTWALPIFLRLCFLPAAHLRRHLYRKDVHPRGLHTLAAPCKLIRCNACGAVGLTRSGGGFSLNQSKDELCASENTGGCSYTFQPNWVDEINITTGTMGKVYRLGDDCRISVCPSQPVGGTKTYITWWGWVLIVCSILLVLGSTVRIILLCHNAKKNKVPNPAADVEKPLT